MMFFRSASQPLTTAHTDHSSHATKHRMVGRCLVAVMVVLAAGSAFAKDALPKKYKDWLDHDVRYIVTRGERDTLRGLATDLDRDKFIERFWEIRNPNPGAPTNVYQEEHYRRLAYASQHFSPSGSGDGWDTDMGRVYITLGPPQQKARYIGQTGVRTMEIWFYQNSHPALPPFFSLIFYEKDFGDFRLYSPYMDGPTKLVTGIQAENGRVAAVKQIDRVLGREVALTTLSLIPGEPVSLNDAESTLQSDLLLGNVKDLANHPFTLDALKLHRSLTEDVTHRVVLPGELLNIVTLPLRDTQGNVRLHYALRLTQPSDFAVAQLDQRYYYSLEALVRVLGSDGKEVFNRQRKIAQYITKDDLEQQKGRPVVYEGWVPLAPGKYKVAFVLTNVLSKTAFTGEREVNVPATAGQDFFVTDPLPFSRAENADPRQADFLPFTVGGIRFTPYVGQELALVAGQDLQFLYQLWRPAAAGQNALPPALLADYAYGRPSVSGTAQTIHEELPANQFDAHGSMVSGKKIPTTELGTGNYRLSISITDPQTQQKRFSAMPFHIVSDSPSTSESWRIDDDGLAEYLKSGQSDVDRGMAYLLAKQTPEAIVSFQEALRKSPANERARARLIDYYFQQRDFGRVAQLFAATSVSEQTEEGTILSVADSFDKSGNAKKAADFLESALSKKAPSAPLYLALASYYQHLGDSAKAENYQRKGQVLLAEPAENKAKEKDKDTDR